MTFRIPLAAAAALSFSVAAAPLTVAHGDHAADAGGRGPHDHGGVVRADSHAPIGVMGDHMHKAGEFMLSYRFMHMDMDGSRDGTDSLSPAEITEFSSPFGPGSIRVVPTDMQMGMHMVGGMYAPSDWLTLMAMGSYITKEMDHVTFAGPAGATKRGEFTTRSEGLGDTKISGLIRVFEDETHHVHLNAGVSVPTGSIEETDDVLTPMGTRPTVRLPYSMQLGSGTFDLLPGVTYTGQSAPFAWGAQAKGVIRLGENDEGYALGDEIHGTAWASYAPEPWISLSGRLIGTSKGAIDGRDPNIAAPVQTADPDNYGGETVEFGVGVNLAGSEGWLRGHRIGAEFVAPLYRDLNGPQMETDWTLTVGYQFAF
ncbi:MAG: transporter [Pseudomonadota bacterium]